MAAAVGSRKLLCACGTPLAVFDAKGLNLYCRFSLGRASRYVPLSYWLTLMSDVAEWVAALI